MADKTFLGIDGCRLGWLAVSVETPGMRLGFRLEQSIAALLEPRPVLALVDIPIGLPHAACPRRACDRAARKSLGSRLGSRVFPPPTREAIAEKNYVEACTANARVVGKKLSKQAWNIAARIAEVDQFLREDSRRSSWLREGHPEVSFAALADGAITASKKRASGQAARFHLLQNLFDQQESVPAFLEQFERYKQSVPRSQAQPDDFLDAAVLAYTAAYTSLQTLPENPSTDALGLPMEIVYGPKTG